MVIGKTFKEDFQKALEVYPGLEYELLKGNKFKYRVMGDFPIVDGDGVMWETFRASIYFKPVYPYGFALLQEVSTNIPRHEDRHISMDGYCCVCGLLESLEMESKAITLLEFIQKYVIPFFANQVHFEHFGYFLNGEYSHHDVGVWEELESILGIPDRLKIKSILKYINTKPGRNGICFCGSGKKVKFCHEEIYQKVLKLLRAKPNLCND